MSLLKSEMKSNRRSNESENKLRNEIKSLKLENEKLKSKGGKNVFQLIDKRISQIEKQYSNSPFSSSAPHHHHHPSSSSSSSSSFLNSTSLIITPRDIITRKPTTPQEHNAKRLSSMSAR